MDEDVPEVVVLSKWNYIFFWVLTVSIAVFFFILGVLATLIVLGG